jgi:hypothetical protein
MFANWFSGATLFAILLNNHSKITCIGETFPFIKEQIDLYTCSCGVPLIKCDYYRKTCSHMLVSGGDDWDREMFVLFPRLSESNLINKWLCGFSHLY